MDNTTTKSTRRTAFPAPFSYLLFLCHANPFLEFQTMLSFFYGKLLLSMLLNFILFRGWSLCKMKKNSTLKNVRSKWLLFMVMELVIWFWSLSLWLLLLCFGTGLHISWTTFFCFRCKIDFIYLELSTFCCLYSEKYLIKILLYWEGDAIHLQAYLQFFCLTFKCTTRIVYPELTTTTSYLV